MRQKPTEHAAGSVCYRNALIVRKSVIKVYLMSRKKQTRNPGLPKWTGFPGPRFFKTRVGIPSLSIVSKLKKMNIEAALDGSDLSETILLRCVFLSIYLKSSLRVFGVYQYFFVHFFACLRSLHGVRSIPRPWIRLALQAIVNISWFLCSEPNYELPKFCC